MSPSIRAQLIGLLAAIFAPLAAVSIWIAWHQYEAQQEAFGQTLISLARALSTGTDRELATGQTLVETLALSPLIDERRFGDLHAMATKAIAGRPGASVVMFDASGNQVFNTARPYGEPLPNVFNLEGMLPAARTDELPRGGAQYVRRAFETAKPVYSDLFIGQVSKSYLVAVSVPVMRNGEMVYCMTIALPSNVFQALVAAQPRLGGAGAVVFDSRGYIIARAAKPEEFVGRPVPQETELAFRAGVESFGRARNVEGESFFRAVVRSPVSGWGAGVAVSDEAAFGAIWRSLRHWAIAALLIFALAICATFWIARAQTQRRAAEEASHAKDRFLAALSHELRNPLAAIALAGEYLASLLGRNHRGREAVDTVNRQVRQLCRLLDDLLDTTRAIYGKLKLSLQPVELRGLAAQVADDHGRRHGSRVRIELKGEPAWVSGDPARVHQMLDNLVDNAIKYGATRVSIGLHAEGSEAVLAVSDDGSGIAPELLDTLFEPFVQGAHAVDGAQAGLGLGLALVRRLAQLQGGSISVRSAGKGKGSVFTLRLPSTAAPAALALDGPQEKAALGKCRILVIEDMADSRETLGALLESEGHEVALAASGPEGLAKLPHFRPDLAIVDIGLPAMDGYEVARQLRAAGGSTITLVALTGYGREEDRRKSREAGFDVHLTKPVSFSALQEILADRPSKG